MTIDRELALLATAITGSINWQPTLSARAC